VTPLYVGREPSLKAFEIAVQEDWPLVVVAQLPTLEEETYPIMRIKLPHWTEISIARSIRLPDGTTSAIAQGLDRVRIVEFTQLEPYLVATVELVEETSETSPLVEALMRAVLAMFEKVVQLNHSLPDEAYVYAMNVSEPGPLADLIAQMLNLELEQRQDLLETFDAVERLQKISAHLAREMDVLELEDQIQTRVQQEVDRSQREYFLREQMRAIQRELGETDTFTRDLNRLQEGINQGDLPEPIRERAQEELEHLSIMPAMAPEVGIIHTYLDWLINLPWTKMTEDNLDISHAEWDGNPALRAAKAKERILEYIAVRKLAPDKKPQHDPLLCRAAGDRKDLPGPHRLRRRWAENLCASHWGAYVTKPNSRASTHLHRSLPDASSRSCGVPDDHNPVFMLDKSISWAWTSGEIPPGLLEVLDPEQNHLFPTIILKCLRSLEGALIATRQHTGYNSARPARSHGGH
jgi:ATP-dependent Lon protease